MQIIYRRLLVLSLVIGLLNWPQFLQGQTQQFHFDISGKLSSSPFSLPFDSKKYNVIQIKAKELADSMVDALSDSLLRRADALEQQLGLYQLIWTKESYEALTGKPGTKGQLALWKRYIMLKNWGGVAGITLFPLLAEKKDFEKGTLLLLNEDKSITRVLDEDYTLSMSPDSPWVVDGLHPEVRFKLVLNDLFKAKLIEFYNSSLTPDISALNTDDLLNKWNTVWVPGLKVLKTGEAALDKEAQDILNGLSNPANKSFKPPADLTGLITTEQPLHQKFVAYYNNDPAVLFIRKNESFFLKWLWFNKGILSFDPFKFTTPGKLSTKLSPRDEMDKARWYLFDDRYRKLADCEICKIYNDTLTIRDLAKQQNRGKEYFPRTDSLKAADSNKLAFQNFRRQLTNIHSFSYPYRREDDSEAVIQQFDAARKYKRVDSLDLDVKGKHALIRRIKRANSFIPDDRMPVISVRNIPWGNYLKLSESTTPVKDQSGFQKILSDSAGIGGAAALATLFSSSTFAHFGSFPVPSPVAPVVPLPKAYKIGPIKPLAVTADSYTVPISFDDITYNLDVKKADSTITNCKQVFTKILQKHALKDSILSPDDEIKRLLDSIGGSICKYTKPNDFDKEARAMILSFEADFQAFDKGRQDAIQQLLNDTSFVTHFIQTRNIQAPPDKLDADITTIADTGLYRTDVVYLNQAQSLTKDAFALYRTTAQDTVLKKVAAGFFALTPRHVIVLGIGPEVTVNNLPINTVTSTGGQLNISQDVQYIRFLVGLHIYPWKIFNPDDRFIIHRQYGVSGWSRLSLFLGTALPTPLQNYYTGLGADLVPGLKISTGVHWAWHTRYTILNNQVENQASGVRYGGWYLGLTIDPLAISSTILSAFK
jgi:hypothetical protein